MISTEQIELATRISKLSREEKVALLSFLIEIQKMQDNKREKPKGGFEFGKKENVFS